MEEVLYIANDMQLDSEFSDVIAQVNEAIHSSVESSITLSNVEASKLIEKYVDSELERNESDKKWMNTDTIGK